ncbi:UNVERIFIED_CONTAM: hypothetical protein PYX00_002676 [Menopon gallinae]|uniref:Ankyrin repeat domain-containing protein 6 n=1 Tax=Menopon gallinae TaxID=328185 RepID=A0AAW2HXD0_9NEOP
MGELLRDAAARGDSDRVVDLLGEGAGPALDEGGRNALHLAAANGHADAVAALLLARWDVNAQDAAGYTPIQRAAAEGHVEVVKQLIKHGANVNIQDKVHGNTALHEASWKGYSKCVEALCQANKVNLQVKNFGGFAPLHLACQNGHNQSCRELLMANCNPDTQNNYGDTPLHTSARYGHAGVTRILISADCHMSDQNKNGDTALHITAAMGRRKLTRILLEAGCDPNRRNKQNERAKDIAIRKDLNEIIEIIDRTLPIEQRERHKEKDQKEGKGGSGGDKKRGKNESGSSKESRTRPKEKKKHKNDRETHFISTVDTKWSPYGCHYYPDPKTFPKPKLDSLPQEPLKKGEQYYLDLAGNIRKGPVGVGYTCYCAPFFRHMEERLDRDKKELKEHIDAAHVRLDKKVTNLEAKTRGQLNEITRSMALERFKCQQRHLHLEQWLIRGSIFRNSEKVRGNEAPSTPLPKSRSLENILEEKTPNGYGGGHRSVEMLCDKYKTERDFIIPGDDLKKKSSSREGTESGKGSSEVVGMGTSEGEEGDLPTKSEERERRLRRSTREISERIDEVLKSGDNTENMDDLYDEMIKWRSYHGERRIDAGERRIERDSANRPSCRNLPEEESPREGGRQRRPSDPRGAIEEPERKSVQEIVAKLQKQQTVQELVAKIQRKTGLIHKSAQKWKDSKSKSKESSAESGELPPNYENVRCWDARDDLSQLPYRCRSGIYSSAQNPDEYRRNVYPERVNDENWFDGGYVSRAYAPSEDGYCEKGYRTGEDYRGKSYEPPSHQVDNQLYRMARGMPDRDYLLAHGMVPAGLRNPLEQPHPSYSPTQNDSGYSTKPYGGSSTGPSPSLSGQEFEAGSTDMKLPQFPIGKRMEAPPSSSLV